MGVKIQRGGHEWNVRLMTTASLGGCGTNDLWFPCVWLGLELIGVYLPCDTKDEAKKGARQMALKWYRENVGRRQGQLFH